MLIRTTQLIFILFWLFTIGALVKTVFWPSESGMVEIDPRRPLQTFLNWGESGRLRIYQESKPIGILSVNTSRPTEKSPARAAISTNFNGQLATPLKGAIANARADFDPDLSIASGSMLVRIPTNDLVAKISFKGDQQVTATLETGGNPIFSYDSNADQLNPLLKGMVNSNPMAASLLASAENGSSISVKAYHGIYHFKKRRLPVFLIKLTTPNDAQKVEIYLSKAGDPLLIKTNFGIQAISELFLAF